MSLVEFSWILVVKIILYPSKFILLLPSYIKSSLKWRGPVPETAMRAHAMTPPPPSFTDELVCLGSFAVPFFLYTFAFQSLRWRLIFVSSVHQLSSKTLLAHICEESCLSIFGADQRFASGCVASVILCQIFLQPVDCQSITPAFWRLLVISQTFILGFIFTAFMIVCHQLLLFI